MSMPGREVTLVLVTPDGRLAGQLPPFPVALPWWADARSVVQGARERHGLEVVVLRLLAAERSDVRGGGVTYLAEVADPPANALPWSGELDDHPLRQSWAMPGGPHRDLEWAEAELAACGLGELTQVEQIRTWNLSSLWRLQANRTTVWLKAVPPFFAHEGPLLARLQGSAVPRLVARGDARVLLEDIDGEDLYDAPLDVMLRMVTTLVDLQASWIGRIDELTAIGLPDWRPMALGSAIRDTVQRVESQLSAHDVATLHSFLGSLDARFAELGGAGLPETLVHGDFHPGNFRGADDRLVLLDWGDSGVGHPLLDAAAFLERVQPEAVGAITAHWAQAWRAAVPGADPELAYRLLRPVAAARQAVIYQKFMDAIEPSEHPYHRNDPALWLAWTAEIARAES